MSPATETCRWRVAGTCAISAACAAPDERWVRRGLIFRSAALDRATDGDLVRLRALGLRWIFDLRADRERVGNGVINIPRWQRDYAGKAGDLRARLASGVESDRDMHAAMVDAYRRLPGEQAPAITAIFTALAREETPLLFHCAAGKDRTGMVAALLLAILGVSRDDIIADYLLTNNHADAIRVILLDHPHLANIGNRDGVLSPLASAHVDYLAALLYTIDAAGSVEAFLDLVAGITPDAIRRIRGHLLER